MLSVYQVAMSGAEFCIVYSFMMFVVGVIGDLIVEVYSRIGLVTGLCMLRVMSPCACIAWLWRGFC